MLRINENTYWPIEEEKLRNVPNGPFVCMFSGGKDSGLALSVACSYGQPYQIIHCLDETKDPMHQKKQVIEKQAKAMNIPLIITDYSPWNRWPKLVKLYRRYAEQGVKSVVFGDLCSDINHNRDKQLSKLQAALCISAGLIPCMPLWHLPREVLLQEFMKRKIRTIITRINSPKITSDWLGKTYDERAYEYFISIGIDPFGEKGEFHTTLVDGDIFKRPLEYKLGFNDGIRLDLNFINNCN